MVELNLKYQTEFAKRVFKKVSPLKSFHVALGWRILDVSFVIRIMIRYLHFSIRNLLPNLQQEIFCD